MQEGLSIRAFRAMIPDEKSRQREYSKGGRAAEFPATSFLFLVEQCFSQFQNVTERRSSENGIGFNLSTSDLDPAEGIRRSHARASAEEVAGDRFDSEKMQFHHDVRNAFLDLAAKEPERFAVIDAGKTAEEVHRQIMEAVHARLEAL